MGGKKRWYGPDRPQKRQWSFPKFGLVEDYYGRYLAEQKAQIT